MAFARDSYTASASQTDFTITFPYLAATDVYVSVDGTTIDNDADADTSSYQIVSSTTVRIGAGLTGGEVVVILRKTSQSSRLVDYASASTLTEEDLDNDSLQAFYMAQEAIDTADTALGLGSNDLWDADNTIIDNVATPTADDHATTKAYVDDAITTAALGTLATPVSVANGGTGGATAAAARSNLSAQEDVITTRGDIIYGDATPAAARLAIGAANRVLTSDGTDPAWGQVATDMIADDAITLAKLAAGTDGELITWDANGDPAAVGAGSSGQLLTSNGAGAAPTFQAAPSSGGFTELEDSGVLSATNSYSFDSDVVDVTTYTRFRVIINAYSSTNTAELFARLQDGGSDETTNYFAGASLAGTGLNYNAGRINLMSGTVGMAQDVYGYLDLIYDPGTGLVFIDGWSGNSTSSIGELGGVYYGGFGTAFNGITIQTSSGNFDGGTQFVLFGAP